MNSGPKAASDLGAMTGVEQARRLLDPTLPSNALIHRTES